jgi:hypothetical protein
MVLTSLASDSFTRSDAVDLGSNWDDGYLDFTNGNELFSNQVRPVVNQYCLDTYNGITWPDDQYGKCTLTFWDTENAVAIVLRATAPTTSTFYLCQTSRFGDTQEDAILKYVAGSSTELSSGTPSAAWATLNVICGAVIGTDIYLLRGTSQVLSASDSAISSGRSGIAGLWFNGGTGGLVTMDDWEGGKAEDDGEVAGSGLLWKRLGGIPHMSRNFGVKIF